MSDKNIILTGFMGTGKTTVGKLLANQLRYKFVDTDETIMSRCNQTITEIFHTHGEAAFRQMERDLALELAQQDRLIISTGGGMMLDSVNVDTLEGKNTHCCITKGSNRGASKTKGIIVCLVADPDAIIARVTGDNTIERPLLKVAEPKSRIAKLLKERKKAYARFIQVDTTGRTPQGVCRAVMELLNMNTHTN